ncbi:MAG TPA: acyl-CoA thioesterase domain-containing protein, partial [Acidimicrobiales bacterium]|nr:acyl-CoA thioesterase domain-containing protein [Acidimicrobiales bacterium]
LLVQSLAAACHSVPDKTPRSIHSVFTAEGRPDSLVRWSVDVVHEGRTFATCAVSGRQGDRLLATSLVSLHSPDAAGAPAHGSPRPPVPGPGTWSVVAAAGSLPVELRAVGDSDLAGGGVGPPSFAIWLRAPRALGAAAATPDPGWAVLAYCSDGLMLASALRPHDGLSFGAPSIASSAVTSHTLSFHGAPSASVFGDGEWMLFTVEAPAFSGGRAYTRGDWYNESGALVASCAQEGLVRLSADSGVPR